MSKKIVGISKYVAKDKEGNKKLNKDGSVMRKATFYYIEELQDSDNYDNVGCRSGSFNVVLNQAFDSLAVGNVIDVLCSDKAFIGFDGKPYVPVIGYDLVSAK